MNTLRLDVLPGEPEPVDVDEREKAALKEAYNAVRYIWEVERRISRITGKPKEQLAEELNEPLCESRRPWREDDSTVHSEQVSPEETANSD